MDLLEGPRRGPLSTSRVVMATEGELSARGACLGQARFAAKAADLLSFRVLVIDITDDVVDKHVELPVSLLAALGVSSNELVLIVPDTEEEEEEEDCLQTDTLPADDRDVAEFSKRSRSDFMDAAWERSCAIRRRVPLRQPSNSFYWPSPQASARYIGADEAPCNAPEDSQPIFQD